MTEDQKIYTEVAQLLYEQFQEKFSNIHFLMYLDKSSVDSIFFQITDSGIATSFRWEYDVRQRQITLMMKELRQIYIDNGWGEWNVVHCAFDPLKPDIEFDFECSKELDDGSISFPRYYGNKFEKNTA